MAKPEGQGQICQGERVRHHLVRARSAQATAVEAALAGIAHDIRTPLTGIVALAELLASSDLGAREREWAGRDQERSRSSGCTSRL